MTEIWIYITLVGLFISQVAFLYEITRLQKRVNGLDEIITSIIDSNYIGLYDDDSIDIDRQYVICMKDSSGIIIGKTIKIDYAVKMIIQYLNLRLERGTVEPDKFVKEKKSK